MDRTVYLKRNKEIWRLLSSAIWPMFLSNLPLLSSGKNNNRSWIFPWISGYGGRHRGSGVGNKGPLWSPFGALSPAGRTPVAIRPPSLRTLHWYIWKQGGGGDTRRRSKRATRLHGITLHRSMTFKLSGQWPWKPTSTSLREYSFKLQCPVLQQQAKVMFHRQQYLKLQCALT
jgi:hypothetical protein